MFKFIGRALAGLVLTKDAQKAVGQRVAAGKGKKANPFSKQAGKGEEPAAREQVLAEAQAQAKGVLTPERAELIRQAMKVRAAKQTILADLDDASRAKLVALAMKALLNEGREKE